MKNSKHIRKIVGTILTVLCILAVLVSCAGGENQKTQQPGNTATAPGSPEEKTNIRIAALKGPTGLGMVDLMNRNEQGTAKNQYTVSLAAAPEEIVAKVTSGQVDIAAVPTNLAATLFNKTNGKVQLAALNTLGVLYLLENGNTIHSIQDLKGKTVYASGKGATPEFILDFILKQNGLDPEQDLEIKYLEEHSAVVASCVANTASVALLPEPNVTTVLSKNTAFRSALDITLVYQEACEAANISNSFLAMGGIIVNTEFAQKNEKAFQAFLEEYKASAAYTNQYIDEAAALAVKYEIIGSEEIAKKAIPNCNIIFISGEEMKQGIRQFYQVLFDAEPKSIGGSLPGEEFYYTK